MQYHYNKTTIILLLILNKIELIHVKLKLFKQIVSKINSKSLNPKMQDELFGTSEQDVLVCALIFIQQGCFNLLSTKTTLYER